MLFVNLIQVAIAAGFHLFPFRTEKLSPFTPMVLRKWESRSLPFLKRFRAQSEALFFCINCLLQYCFLPGRFKNGSDLLARFKQYHRIPFLSPAYNTARSERGRCHLFLVCHRQTRSLWSLGGPPGPRSRSRHSLAPIPSHLR